jgi:signal transduction histidine kinase
MFSPLLAGGKGRCDDHRIDRRSLALTLLAAPTAALVVVGVNQAREHPELAPGGAGLAALAVQLAAGLALAVAAVEVARRREFAVSAALLVAVAGLGLHALPEPPASAALFTLALVGAGAPAAAAAHVALAHPGGRAGAALDRVAAVTGYAVTVVLLGLLPALVFDARRTGCFDCPANLLLVHADPGAADWLARWTPRAAAVTEGALAVLVVARLLRRPAVARALAAPVSVAAVAALSLSAWENVRAAGGLAGTRTDRLLWLATAVALGLVAAGLAWRPIRAVRLRAALGRLTVATAASAHDVRDVLSRALGDSGVRILWPHPETRAPLDLDGALAATAAPPGRARTAVERSGRVVAWVEHRADLRAAPELLTTAVRSAGLTLEREALRATKRLQVQDLHDSTRRLVSAGEAERRLLERDLHDGAQQRLLALGLMLTRARAAAPPELAGQLTAVEARAAATRDALRQIAHGIHSVTLAEGGLAEAVLALVQAHPGGVAVEALPERRASAEAEAAVYRLVATSLRLGCEGRVRIAIHARGETLDAAISIVGADPAALTEAVAHATARIAGLGGSLTVAAMEGGATASASVPAVS